MRIVLGGQGELTLNSLQISNTTDRVSYADGLYKSESTIGSAKPSAGKGDVDNDGSVDTKDTRSMLKYSNGTITYTEVQKENADYDEDGVFSTSDIRKLLKELLG